MSQLAAQPETRHPAKRWLLLAALPVLLHLAVQAPVEPVFNGDANRHVMTSVFFRDFLVDLPLSNPRQYAENYYEQYPALGLLIWPPLFHGAAGALMAVFGTSVWIPRLFVFACFAGSAVWLYRICRRRVSAEQSELTVLIYSLMPMIFMYSRHVMLEMPTLAMCLLCMERFDGWLSEQRTRDLYIAAVAAALAALTRFDAVMLLPTLLLMAVFEGRWKLLFNRHVAIAAVVACVVLGPTYYVIWREMGELHLRQAVENVSGRTRPAPGSEAMTFYPAQIPDQTGWAVAIFLAAGLMAAARQKHRAAAAAFTAILIGTYVTFTPLAELSARHSIYWLPAIAWFAALGVTTLSTATHRLIPRSYAGGALPACLILTATACTTFGLPVYRVRGYAEAVTAALNHTQAGESIFVDGWWDGNLTYHIRHLDASRSRHVIRADRLLYNFTNVPTVDFKQFVESDCDMLRAIATAAPARIVFEDPQPFGRIPISEHMRSLIRSLPEQFPPLAVVPVTSTVPQARPFVLRVFAVDLPALQTYIDDLEAVADDDSGGWQGMSSANSHQSIN